MPNSVPLLTLMKSGGMGKSKVRACALVALVALDFCMADTAGGASVVGAAVAVGTQRMAARTPSPAPTQPPNLEPEQASGAEGEDGMELAEEIGLEEQCQRLQQQVKVLKRQVTMMMKASEGRKKEVMRLKKLRQRARGSPKP